LFSSAILAVLFGLSACGSGDEDMPRSNHIDSTNEYGVPPVDYNDNAASDTMSRFPTSDDTGRRANTEAVEEGGQY